MDENYNLCMDMFGHAFYNIEEGRWLSIKEVMELKGVDNGE